MNNNASDDEQHLPSEARNLVKVTHAYHVTRLKVEEDRPLYTELKCNIANDQAYDGVLVGLSCVFFTTTLFDKKLPNISPFPTDKEAEGQKYKRVKIPLSQFNNYDMWFCKGIKHPQVRLVLTKGDERSYIENIPGITEIDKANNPYLCHHSGKWYSTNYTKTKGGKFVNFVVLKDFPLQAVEWDKVTSKSMIGHPLDRNKLAVVVATQWSIFWKIEKLYTELPKEDDLFSKCDNLIKIPDQQDLPSEARNLVEVTHAYHVTRLKVEEDRPLYTELKWDIANDPTYDGVLLGLPCVFFTTTDKNELPNNSPFPTDKEAEGQKYKRVKIPLSQFKDYDMWSCKDIKHPQVRLVLTKGDERSYIENIPGITEIDKANNQYLCHRNGQWYSTNYTTTKEDKFVNFVVLKDFPLQEVEWDEVTSKSMIGHSLDRNDVVATQWSMFWKTRKLYTELSKEADLFSRFDKLMTE